MKFLKSVLLAGLCILLSCDQSATDKHQKGSEPEEQEGHHHHGANEHMNQRSFEDLVERFESPERVEWQKPDSVIARFGPLEGKTVMEIGSGTGYFSFRIAEKGARVICADVDERFLDYIREKRAKLGMESEQMELRKVPYDSPDLRPEEVDIVLIVNTYHHIENRTAYFQQVLKGLKPDGRLFVVDFKKEESPYGPPEAMRLRAGKVVGELKDAGFTECTVNQDLLPYQYIIEAR